jgi:hypothetical protein
MAEHKLEPSRLLALLDDAPDGVFEDYLDDLPAFSRIRRQSALDPYTKSTRSELVPQPG